MATKTYPMVRGRMMRVTRLDGCGAPDYGDAGTVVSKGFVTIGVTANINEGQAITITNADGSTAVSDPAVPELENFTLAITYTKVDPDIYALTTGQATVLDASGDAVGFRVNSDVSPTDTAFGLEVWSTVPGEACSTDPNAQGAFAYILFPYVSGGVISDFTIENGAISFGLANATTKKGTQWGTGPYNVVLDGGSTPSVLLSAAATADHLHVQYTELAPPTEYTGAIPLLDPSGTDISSITLTPTGATVELSVTPSADFATEPIVVWWGDGSDYDYIDQTGATVDHVYAADGDYDVTVWRGLSTITDTVTVDVP